MQRLVSIIPELIAELEAGLIAEGRPDLVAQVSQLAVDHCTHSVEAGLDLGYIYFIRCPPSASFEKLAAPVAETIPFDDGNLNVDLDHEGQLFGVELIDRSDLTSKLRQAGLL